LDDAPEARIGVTGMQQSTRAFISVSTGVDVLPAAGPQDVRNCKLMKKKNFWWS